MLVVHNWMWILTINQILEDVSSISLHPSWNVISYLLVFYIYRVTSIWASAFVRGRELNTFLPFYARLFTCKVFLPTEAAVIHRIKREQWQTTKTFQRLLLTAKVGFWRSLISIQENSYFRTFIQENKITLRIKSKVR